MRFQYDFGLAGKIAAIMFVLVATNSCSDHDVLSLTVNARGRAISTIAMVIAKDQGLYEKHGLNVTLLLPPPDNENGRESPSWIETWRRRVRVRLGYELPAGDISMAGGSPQMLRAIQVFPEPHRILIGSTDCMVRAHLIGRRGLEIESLDDLAGLRLGAGRFGTTGFQVLLLAQRMGWNPSRDIEFVDARTDSLEALDAGTLDVLFANERTYSRAVEEGYPILFDTAVWNEEVAGNSIAVFPEWLENPTNREAAKRFLMAIAEAISLYHQDRELALQIMDEWNGLRGAYAERIYERGAWMPRKPYPCPAGLRKSLELYGAPEVQAMGFAPLPDLEEYSVDEFYDDSIMREIDASGFFDALY